MYSRNSNSIKSVLSLGTSESTCSKLKILPSTYNSVPFILGMLISSPIYHLFFHYVWVYIIACHKEQHQKLLKSIVWIICCLYILLGNAGSPVAGLTENTLQNPCWSAVSILSRGMSVLFIMCLHMTCYNYFATYACKWLLDIVVSARLLSNGLSEN